MALEPRGGDGASSGVDVVSSPKEKLLNLFHLPVSGVDLESSFELYNPELGRYRKIPTFAESLQIKCGDRIDLLRDGGDLFRQFNEEYGQTVDEIAARLKYLGLNKNLLVDGENSEFVSKIVKSMDFGRQTREDRGHATKSIKNYIATGDEPSLTPIYTAISGAAAIGPIEDSRLLELIKTLTDGKTIEKYNQDYPTVASQPDNLTSWIINQAIVRRLLPHEPQVESRQIDIQSLELVKYIGTDPDSDPGFQASNPVSIWVDREHNRKFIVKECPEPTLQADYFGLEMLQLAGVPIYEFYFGERVDDKTGEAKRVLVSGFLEGFSDPSKVVSLPDSAPPEMIKTILPDNLKKSRHIQQGLLVEILIGEYNSKAHNYMVLGDSVQHLDQGGSLTSTASGKFKGFSSQLTIQDIEDVIHCYSDWDADLQQSTNEAYSAVAEVINGELTIKDRDVAQHLLYQLRSIPQEKIDLALENAGYVDGEESITRMRAWMDRIDKELMPQYLAKEPSKRRDQYIRWLSSAKETFTQAIEMGGELSYYKYAIKERRARLERIWLNAIEKK